MNYLRFIITLLSILAGSLVVASDMQGYLSPANNENIELKQGEFFEGVLRILPAQNLNIKSLLALEGKEILHAFHVAKLEKVSLSENNREVMEVYGIYILKKTLNKDSFYVINIDGKNIPVRIQKISSIGKDVIPSSYYYFDQQDAITIRVRLVVFVIILFTIGLIAIYWIKRRRRIMHEKRRQKELILARDYWKGQFLVAEKRDHFQAIFDRRAEWLPLIEGRNQVLNFINMIDLNQYKREWSEFDLWEVNDRFNEIRNSFDGV